MPAKLRGLSPGSLIRRDSGAAQCHHGLDLPHLRSFGEGVSMRVALAPVLFPPFFEHLDPCGAVLPQPSLDIHHRLIELRELEFEAFLEES